MKQLYYKIDKCLGCKSCEIACSLAHSESGDLLKAIRQTLRPLTRKKVLFSEGKNYPLSCRSCKDPKCMDACMAGAITVDRQKRISHDNQRCVGCWMCVMVCPFGAIRPDIQAKIPLRCDRCTDKPRLSSESGLYLKEGRGEDEPACVRACPTAAIVWQEEIEVRVD
jgi:carbon-monoxide dehydrogenase iron sulfur subunit